MPPTQEFTATVGDCLGCDRRTVLNEAQHCVTCLKAAMKKAQALDSLDAVIQDCLEVGINEVQIRDATLKAVEDIEGPLTGDGLLARRWDGSQHGWTVRSSWLLAAADRD